MSHAPQVLFCVDDDPMSCFLLESIFAKDYRFEAFNTAECCLARLEACQPDILLLDITLPGMDGYELCRRIKADPATAAIPVLFISGDADPEARLKGYEAGGEEFILKPYAIDDVRHRVSTVRRALEQARSYRMQLADSEELSSLLLANMDEYAVLIRFMRTLNECKDEEGVAEALLGMLENFRLHGAVQIRCPDRSFTLSPQGRNRPLEESTIAHLATMDRIFSFRRRSAYNFDTLTLLVNDMPIDDADLCGRLRDHLAIAAEMADARIRARIAEQRYDQAQAGIAALLPEIRGIIRQSLERSQSARQETRETLRSLLEQLEFSFTPLGLSEELEEEIIQMVHTKSEEILAVFKRSEESAEPLQALEAKLQGILGR